MKDQSAFPQHKFTPYSGGCGIHSYEGGMSLRDWIAGQVLASADALPFGTSDYKHRARVAYEMADATSSPATIRNGGSHDTRHSRDEGGQGSGDAGAVARRACR